MTAETFDNQIRNLIRARPFQPFSIVLEDGRMLDVDKPKVAFNNGGAGFVDSVGEIQLVECEQVRDFQIRSEKVGR